MSNDIRIGPSSSIRWKGHDVVKFQKVDLMSNRFVLELQEVVPKLAIFYPVHEADDGVRLKRE